MLNIYEISNMKEDVMHILLIQPSEFESHNLSRDYIKHGKYKIQKRLDKLRSICLPPMGLLYLSTSMKNAGHKVTVLDAFTLQLTNGEIVNETLMEKPDIVGISMYSSYLKMVYNLTSTIKKKLNIPVVAGGAHPNAMPVKTLNDFENVDYLLTGWADFSIVDFTSMLEGRKSESDVAGLYYRENGKVVNVKENQIDIDMDSIPIPDRNILSDMYDRELYYNIVSKERNIDVLMTSRNCPYSCKFCQNINGHKLLLHSIDRVVDELDYLHGRGVKAVEIMDDTFTAKKKRAEAILDIIATKNYGMEFRIRSRTNLINEDLLKKFKSVGGRAVSYGMESGSDRVLKLMNKNTTVEHNRNACIATKKAGLICHSTWLFGWPGEELEDIDKSFKFIERYLPHTFNIGILVPIPGTPIYEEAKKDGSIRGEWSTRVSTYPFVVSDVWTEREKLSKYLNKRLRKSRRNPKYILQTLKLVMGMKNIRLFVYGVQLLVNRLHTFS